MWSKRYLWNHYSRCVYCKEKIMCDGKPDYYYVDFHVGDSGHNETDEACRECVEKMERKDRTKRRQGNTFERRLGLIIEGALNFHNPALGCKWAKERVQIIKEEMQIGFPISFFKDKTTVDKLIAFWEKEIGKLQTCGVDKRTLISFMKSYVESLKWYSEWF